MSNLNSNTVLDLLEQLDRFGTYRVAFETNGTIVPITALVERVAQWNVSPKLSGSGNSAKRALHPEALRAFAMLPNADFKFVISSEDDLLEALNLCRLYDVRNDSIYLMPEGRTSTEVEEHGRWLVERCKEHGVNFSTRLHVHLWGAARGV